MKDRIVFEEVHFGEIWWLAPNERRLQMNEELSNFIPLPGDPLPPDQHI